MEIVKQVCPNCKTRLKIKRADNVPSMLVNCPVCGNSFTATFTAPTPPPLPPQQDTDGTIFDPPIKQPRGITASLNCNGIVYPLKPGRNIVGSMKMNSKADVMLQVRDMFMSRHHACIYVKPDRVTITAFPGNERVPIIVDGLRLRPGDEIKLQPGSLIIMGATRMFCAIM